MSAMSKRFENIKQGKVPVDNIKDSAACADKAADNNKALPPQVQNAVNSNNGAGGLPETAVKDVAAKVGSTGDEGNLTKVVPAVEQESGLPETAVKDVAAKVGSDNEDEPLQEGVAAVRPPKFTDGQLVTVGNEGVFGGAVLGFLLGPFATSWLGHKHGNKLKEVKELEKKLEERQRHLKELEAGMVSEIKKASHSSTPSTEGVIGAVAGAAAGVATGVVAPGIGPGVLGAVAGSNIDRMSKEAVAVAKEIEVLRRKLENASSELVRESAAEVSKIEAKKASNEAYTEQFTVAIPSIEGYGAFSGGFLGFLLGPFGTAWLGHKYEKELKNLKDLKKERDELQAKVDAAERQTVASIRQGVREGASAGVEDLRGGVIGAVGGLGAQLAVPLVGPAIVGGVYGHSIKAKEKELEELQKKLREVDSRIDQLTGRLISHGPRASTEDLDPGAQKLQPAKVFAPKSEHCDEAADAYRQLEADATMESLESLEVLCGQLDEVQASVESMNSNGGVDAASAYFASAAVRTMHKRLNMPASKIVSGLESAVEASEKHIVSTESLIASLEEIQGASQSMWKRFVGTLVRRYNPIWTRSKIAAMGLRSLKKSVANLKFERPKIMAPSGIVDQGKHMNYDVTDGYVEAANKLHYMVTDFTKQADADFKFNEKLVIKAAKAESGTFIRLLALPHHQTNLLKEVPSIVSQWRDPRDKLGGVPSYPLVGNIVLFHNDVEYKRVNNKDLQFLMGKAYLDTPVLAGYHARGAKKDKIEVNGFTPHEISVLCDMFLKCLEGVTLWKRIVSDMSEPTTKWHLRMRRRGVKAAKDAGISPSRADTEEGKEILKALAAALDVSNRMRFHVGFDASLALLKVIKNFKTLAKLSMSAGLKASNEAFDDNTEVSGVSTNDMSKNEPDQVPVPGGTAIAGEVQPKKKGINDEPATFQTIEGQPGAQHGMESFHESLPYWA